ncbi:unnamed protein product [Rodentolepis nana]|uniref:Voltage-gated hydrogen channel 1 n=1 Tax=Rodentolepis nana TaxID=102285 RepID=A0A0R3TY16_RODNA|nr:unnamed protein product [Rodentolepis nana]
MEAEKKTLEYEREHQVQKTFRYYCTSNSDPQSIFLPSVRDTCCQLNRSSVMYEAIRSPFALCCQAKPDSNCGRKDQQLFTVFHAIISPWHEGSNKHCSHLTCCLSQLGRFFHNPKEAIGDYGSCHFFHTIACILHFLSISILCIFVLQLAVKIMCMGRAFFRLKFEIVDGIIIIASLIADAIFVYIASDEITLIIVFLIWRIIRVVNIAKSGKEVTKNAIRSMAFLTSEIITQFAVGLNPKNLENNQLSSSCSAIPCSTQAEVVSGTSDCRVILTNNQRRRNSIPSSTSTTSPQNSPPLWTKLKPS